MVRDLGGVSAYGGIRVPKIEEFLLNLRAFLSVPYGLLVLIAVLSFFPGIPISFVFAVIIAVGTLLLGLTVFVYPLVARAVRTKENLRLLTLASAIDTPVSELAELACSRFTDVRGGVAANPSTPLPVLVSLFEDDTLMVRESVGSAVIKRLDALPKDLLLNIASGKTPLEKSTAKQAVQSPRITSDELEKIVATAVTPVRWGVVFNKNLNFNTMVKLLNDPDRFVRGQMRGVLKEMSPERFTLIVANSDYSEMAGVPREWVLKSLNVSDSPLSYTDLFG